MDAERISMGDVASATADYKADGSEVMELNGRYTVECFDSDGNLKWSEEFENTVMTLGKNLALDTLLAGSSYSVTGPYMGLISSASYSAISAADTMASHAGWLEAGSANAPTYSGSRKTAAFDAAASGSKALTAALSFSITGTGTVKGVFLVLGTSASATIANTSGVLYSAGTFTGGDKVVASGDTINASYTASA